MSCRRVILRVERFPVLNSPSLAEKQLPRCRALTSGGRRALCDLAHRHTRAQKDVDGVLSKVKSSSGHALEMLCRSDQAVRYANAHLPDADKPIAGDMINQLIMLLTSSGEALGSKKLRSDLDDKKKEVLRLIGRDRRRALLDRSASERSGWRGGTGSWFCNRGGCSHGKLFGYRVTFSNSHDN